MLIILKIVWKLFDINFLFLVYDMYMYVYVSYVFVKLMNMFCLLLICNLVEIIDKRIVLNGYCLIFV